MTTNYKASQNMQAELYLRYLINLTYDYEVIHADYMNIINSASRDKCVICILHRMNCIILQCKTVFEEFDKEQRAKIDKIERRLDYIKSELKLTDDKIKNLALGYSQSMQPAIPVHTISHSGTKLLRRSDSNVIASKKSLNADAEEYTPSYMLRSLVLSA